MWWANYPPCILCPESRRLGLNEKDDRVCLMAAESRSSAKHSKWPFALAVALSLFPYRTLRMLHAHLGAYDLLVGNLVTAPLTTWRKRLKPISFERHSQLAWAWACDRGSAASEPVSTVSTPDLTSSPVFILCWKHLFYSSILSGLSPCLADDLTALLLICRSLPSSIPFALALEDVSKKHPTWLDLPQSPRYTQSKDKRSPSILVC